MITYSQYSKPSIELHNFSIEDIITDSESINSPISIDSLVKEMGLAEENVFVFQW